MNNTKGGLSIIGILILGVLLIIALGYFDVDLKSVVESPKAQNNVNYVKGGIEGVWNNHLKKPASESWDFLSNSFKKLRDKESFNTNWDFTNFAPSAMPSTSGDVNAESNSEQEH